MTKFTCHWRRCALKGESHTAILLDRECPVLQPIHIHMHKESQMHIKFGPEVAWNYIKIFELQWDEKTKMIIEWERRNITWSMRESQTSATLSYDFEAKTSVRGEKSIVDWRAESLKQKIGERLRSGGSSLPASTIENRTCWGRVHISWALLHGPFGPT